MLKIFGQESDRLLSHTSSYAKIETWPVWLSNDKICPIALLFGKTIMFAGKAVCHLK